MPRQEQQRPNILWICPDMLRYDVIGCLGNPHIKTPNMDRLASQGVAFTRAYCQNPTCGPSRASFLTGRYPFATGVVGNGNEFFPPEEKLVTKTLSEVGYDCGLVGKLHLAAAFENYTGPDGRPLRKTRRTEPRPDDGYRVFHWNHDPMNVWKEGDEYHEWVDEQGVDLAALRKAGAIPERLHQSTWCADRAIDFIEREGQSPWLLSANLFHPHAAFDVPIDTIKRMDVESLPGPLFRESDLATQNEYLKDVDFLCVPASRRPEDFPASALDGHQGGLSRLSGDRGKLLQAAHWLCVEMVDRQIGRILEALEAGGQRENTVVILHSDHGQPYGDHGLLSTGCRFYESIMHVPLVFSWPGRFKEGLHARGLVELIDVAPTLHDLLGLPLPENVHGQSLLPILEGKADPDRIKEGVRSEYYFSANTFDDRVKGSYGTMYRDERYKLSVYHGLDVGELYDLENDPQECDNLWESPAHADVKHRLIKACFDRSMLAIDRGPRQIAGA